MYLFEKYRRILLQAASLSLLASALTLSGCSIDKMMVKATEPVIASGVDALNRETDLKLAEDSIPTNLKMLEGMIGMDPENTTLRAYAAQAFYGLSYGFNEDTNRTRAVRFYKRGLAHGLKGLEVNGFTDLKTIPLDELEKRLAEADKDDVPLLFWTASNWAKLIDQRRDASGLVQLPRPTAMMQRVLELNERYYYGGAHMYFGVYYGGRSPMFGGDFERSEAHFDKARSFTDGKLLVADLLHAQYLSRQKFDQEDFHNRLTMIVEAPDDLLPRLALLNQIAKRKAALLLKMEKEWF